MISVHFLQSYRNQMRMSPGSGFSVVLSGYSMYALTSLIVACAAFGYPFSVMSRLRSIIGTTIVITINAVIPIKMFLAIALPDGFVSLTSLASNMSANRVITALMTNIVLLSIVSIPLYVMFEIKNDENIHLGRSSHFALQDYLCICGYIISIDTKSQNSPQQAAGSFITL